MAEIMAPDLAVIIGEPVRKRARFRQQHQTHIFIGVPCEQDDVGRLKIFPPVAQVIHAAHSASALVHFDRRDVRARDHL